MKTHRLAQTLGPPHVTDAAAAEVHALDKKVVDFHHPGRRSVQNE